MMVTEGVFKAASVLCNFRTPCKMEEGDFVCQ